MFQLTDLSREEIRALSADFESRPLVEILTWAWERFGTKAAIGTSFQGAGLVMIDHAIRAGLPIPVFTLDTGLLFPETIALQKRLEDFFEIKIENLLPEQTVEEQAAEYGAELWKKAPDVCCTLRKVAPLQKKLETLSVVARGDMEPYQSPRDSLQSAPGSRLPFDRLPAMHATHRRGRQRAGRTLDRLR
jgi:phosphoadenosine phosphosulfate reductase